MRTIAASLLGLLLGVPAAATADPSTDPTRHVRGVTVEINRLIHDGIKRSPTLAALVTALNKTDVIVHVEEVQHLPPRTEGRLIFTTAAGDVRYLRVQIQRGMGPSDVISILGHELQHAMEVAEHRNVRDTAGFIALYERIGEKGHRNQYDTAAARLAGWKVRNELQD